MKWKKWFFFYLYYRLCRGKTLSAASDSFKHPWAYPSDIQLTSCEVNHIFGFHQTGVSSENSYALVAAQQFVATISINHKLVEVFVAVADWRPAPTNCGKRHTATIHEEQLLPLQPDINYFCWSFHCLVKNCIKKRLERDLPLSEQLYFQSWNYWGL